MDASRHGGGWMQQDDILQDFLSEAEERFSLLETQLIVLERRPDDADALAAVFRGAHSLKGTCGFLGFTRLGHLAHAAEDLMSYLRAEGIAIQGFHVDALLQTLEVMRRVSAQIAAAGKEPAALSTGEKDLIIALKQMARGAAAELPRMTEDAVDSATLPTVRVGADVLDNLLALGGEMALAQARLTQASAADIPALRHMAQLLADMQGEILRARMQPVMEAWRNLPRIVRDMAAACGVQARLETQGGDAQLDRHVLDMVRDPIAHLVRNCLSHGIEPAAARRAAGKDEEGVIKLAARTAEGRMLLSVSDDGRGLDFAAIRRHAAENDLAPASALADMDETALAALIFRAGFSTAPQVSGMAGRGVGLDAVSSQMALIGGTVAVAGQEGGGTVFTLSIPLTLAMIPAAVMRTEDTVFVLPRAAVAGFARLPQHLPTIGGQIFFEWRGRHIPLTTLGSHADEPMAAIIFASGRYAAIRAAEIVAMTQVLVKPLPPMLPQAARYLGVTLQPGGAPALILDARQWAMQYGVPMPAAVLPAAKAGEDYLVFGMNGRRMALPVKSVRQILRVPASALHRDRQGNMFWSQGDALRPLKNISDQTGAPQMYIVETARGDAAQCEAIEGIYTGEPSDAAQPIMLAGRAAEILQAEAPVHATRGGRILLVDDSDFFCSLLTPFLKEAGYDVTSVPDAAQALALREQGEDFSLIISDIEMPGMNGLDFARDVKGGRSAWRHVPLMALSAHATRHDEHRGRVAGFDDFITKFDRSGLLQKIAGLCGRS